MRKKVVIAAGGTGGHLFPAQALAVALKEKCPDIEVFFMAKGLQNNKHFRKDLFSFQDVISSSLSKNPLKLLYGCFQLLQGSFQSRKAMQKFLPDLVIGFGSYHTFPVLLAATFQRTPIILHESNSIAGKVNRFFSKKARWTGVFFPEAKKSFKGASRQVTVPLRKEFEVAARPSKKQALEYYGLDPDKKTILVFGGSQGARGINELFLEALSFVEAKQSIQVLHFTGSTSTAIAAYERYGIKAIVKEFEAHMQYAWAACDFVVSRSGAASIAEQIAFQVPAIMIPYPYAADNHQAKNAEFVEKVIQGAIVLEEKTLVPQKLFEAISRLLDDATRAQMKANLMAHFVQSKNSDFSDEILQFLKGDML
jgi:UDP-N-acetylglucosamine--N-acetylmuramyl-(pentapeptide) pyrophosphoryl-undecaprenol N-acetylglucosamine transferase